MGSVPEWRCIECNASTDGEKRLIHCPGDESFRLLKEITVNVTMLAEFPSRVVGGIIIYSKSVQAFTAFMIVTVDENIEDSSKTVFQFLARVASNTLAGTPFREGSERCWPRVLLAKPVDLISQTLCGPPLAAGGNQYSLW